MDNSEYINQYFNHTQTEENKQTFRKRLSKDKAFAKEVAESLALRKQIRAMTENDVSDKDRQELQNIINSPQPLWISYKKYITAGIAAMLVMAFGIYFFSHQQAPQTLDGNENIELIIQKADSLYNIGDTLNADALLKPHLGDIRVEKKYLNAHK